MLLLGGLELGVSPRLGGFDAEPDQAEDPAEGKDHRPRRAKKGEKGPLLQG